MHIQNKQTVLHRLLDHLRPGGIVVFHEPDFTYHGATRPRIMLFEQAERWIFEAFRCVGAETEMGSRLPELFVGAGLPYPEMIMEVVSGGGEHWGGYEHIASIVRGLLPLIVKSGIATEQEVGIDTLAQRLREEVVRQHAVVMGMNIIRSVDAENVRKEPGSDKCLLVAPRLVVTYWGE